MTSRAQSPDEPRLMAKNIEYSYHAMNDTILRLADTQEALKDAIVARPPDVTLTPRTYCLQSAYHFAIKHKIPLCTWILVILSIATNITMFVIILTTEEEAITTAKALLAHANAWFNKN